MPVLLYAPAAPALPAWAAVPALPDTLDGVSGLWLDATPDALQAQLPALRRHPAAAHLPVFTRAAPPLAVAALADGRADDAGSASRLAAAWVPSPPLLTGAAAQPALRLARYLFLRPGQCLRPQRDWRHPATYRYPLLEAFADDDDADGLLRTLHDAGWLAPLHLVDRLRRCAHCHASHLNYVDVCPRCHALEIVETRFLHCFTCAHVAPEMRFRRDDQLVCPNCLTRLRHIGADYNRPMEQQHCLNCEHMFLEALVVARCLGCDHEDTPDRLPVAAIHDYGLSDRGHQGARSGALAAPVNALARPHQMEAATFAGLLDWQLSLAHRGPARQGFSLLALRLTVPAALAQALGNVALAQLLEAFAQRLGALARDTDLLARPSDLRFWWLLPGTGADGVAPLLERVQALAGDSRQAAAPPLTVTAAAWSAPGELDVGTRAADLLAQLEARLGSEA